MSNWRSVTAPRGRPQFDALLMREGVTLIEFAMAPRGSPILSLTHQRSELIRDHPNTIADVHIITVWRGEGWSSQLAYELGVSEEDYPAALIYRNGRRVSTITKCTSASVIHQQLVAATLWR